MQLKQTLLAATAVAALASVAPAQAASDMYVNVFGGANFLADDSETFNGGESGFASDPDTGFVIGGAIGTHLDRWSNGLKVEMEVSYRRNDVGGDWFTETGDTGGYLDGNTSTFAILANAWYDIDIGTKVMPYVGGGVGWGRAQWEVQAVETFNFVGPVTPFPRGSREEKNAGFTWQLGLGINYEVAPDVDVGIGYRYFVGPRFGNGANTDGFYNFNSDSRHDNANHAVQVSLTIGIN